MRKSILILSIIGAMSASAQDSVFNRNITVEREFQPIIQAAGKINRKPEVAEPQIEATPVTYSDYSSSVAPDYNVSTSLLSQPYRFTKSEERNGELTVGVGHTSTLLDFTYHKQDKRNTLTLKAEHEACWGRKAVEQSNLSLDFQHRFSSATMYFDVNGGNLFYTRYGHYFDPESKEGVEKKFSELTGPYDRETAWMGGANIGIRSNKGSNIEYDVRTGYHAFHMAAWATEHQINTRARVAWTSDVHKAGINLDLLNLLYALHTELPEGKINRPRHSLFIEPFYEYNGSRIHLHAGVNMDLAFNKGQQFSGSKDIAFAPSPKIRMEALLVPKWLALYVNAEGRFARGSMQAYNRILRYIDMMPVLYSQHVGEYIPVNGEIGFNIRPQKNLLLQIHAGYEYRTNTKISYAILAEDGIGVDRGMLNFLYANRHAIRVGGELSYHYRDIIDVRVWGDYRFGKQATEEGYFENKFAGKDYFAPVAGHLYDFAPFELGARVEGHIDRNWSIYTDLEASGSRTTLTSAGEYTLRPIVEWNIGAAYDWQEKNLKFFVSLHNLLCRYNDLYYGYRSEGMNFLLGATWKF